MASLKAFLTIMGKVVGVTADALYSRQRALVQLDVLTANKGRGPGSGVELSEHSVAAIIVALMAADTLSATDERVRAACEAKPGTGSACEWTGEANLRNSIAAILASEPKLRSLRSISLYRGVGASIFYQDGNDNKSSHFRMPGTVNDAIILITAVVVGGTIRDIGQRLEAALADNS